MIDPHPYEKCVDTPQDITNPKTFIISSILCIIFGCLVGAGFWITFSAYHLSLDKAIGIITILFFTGAIPSVFLHWWQNRNLSEPILPDYSDYDEGEEGE